MVSGIGTDRGAFELRRVVTNLAVLDFRTPDGSMRLASVHPGVTVDDVVAATGFDLVIDADVPVTREPEPEELRVLDLLDPSRSRDREAAA